MNVQTLTSSVNIALTDEYLEDIDKGDADVYDVATRTSLDFPESELGVVRVADLTKEPPERYEVIVRRVF